MVFTVMLALVRYLLFVPVDWDIAKQELGDESGQLAALLSIAQSATSCRSTLNLL